LIVTGLLVFGRLGGLFLSLPIFSADGVPRHVPVLSAVAMTMLIVPTVTLAADPTTVSVLVGAFSGEVMLGVLMGSCVRAVFGAMSLAAEVMSGQMGLAMATLFDPMLRTNQGLLGTIGSWLAGVVFLGAGLHLQAIEVVAGSFQVVPAGAVESVLRGGPVLLDSIAATLVLGVQLAGPVVALVWMVNCFVAVLSRLAPNMNVFFSVGMVLTNVAGILLFAIALPVLLTVHLSALTDATEWMGNVLDLVR
jgi:flagellar biosynthetic protein FliR